MTIRLTRRQSNLIIQTRLRLEGNALLAVVCPGQGSQSPGMLKSWLNSELGNHISEIASQISNLDIKHLGSNATKEDISDTSLAQVLITLNTLISAELLNIRDIKPDQIIVSGHSVGEISSYFLAGIYTLNDALEIVTSRGKLMSEAARENPNTGMVAILGGDREEIINEISKFNLVPANINSSSQIVAAGKLENIDKLFNNPPKGTKLVKLDVSAAFHSDFMLNAKVNFASFVDKIIINDLKFRLVTNNQGKLLTEKLVAMNELVGQITSPVRWDLCQETIKNEGVTGLLELAPGGTLVGIAKREIPGVEMFALKSIEDISSASDFVRKHTND